MSGKKLQSKLKQILKIIYSFNAEEQRYFKGTFFLGNTDTVILDELQCSDNMIKHIKKSTIIKFALAMDIAVLK